MSENDKTQASRQDSGKDPEKLPRDREVIMKSALVRTQLSAENTLLAWIRTSVSLYTFGFTIAKFFAYLAEQRASSQVSGGAQNLGLALIFAGIVALVFAVVEHVKVSRKLRELGLPISSHLSLPVGSAVMLLAIGGVLLVSVLLNGSV